jgi:hypothetical protein
VEQRAQERLERDHPAEPRGAHPDLDARPAAAVARVEPVQLSAAQGGPDGQHAHVDGLDAQQLGDAERQPPGGRLHHRPVVAQQALAQHVHDRDQRGHGRERHLADGVAAVVDGAVALRQARIVRELHRVRV